MASSRRTVLTAGTLVAPGAVLSADAPAHGSAPQSALILMPDGQRLVLGCDDEARCSRGFRLPALSGVVDSESVAAFEQVAAVRSQASSNVSSIQQTPRLAHPSNLLRFESVGTFGQDGLVDATDAVKALPPGKYRLVIRGLSGGDEREIQWSAPGPLHLPLRSSALYQFQFYGTLNVERMRGSLLVVPETKSEDISERLDHLRELLNQWNEQSPGWPSDDFLAAYLQALQGAL